MKVRILQADFLSLAFPMFGVTTDNGGDNIVALFGSEIDANQYASTLREHRKLIGVRVHKVTNLDVPT